MAESDLEIGAAKTAADDQSAASETAADKSPAKKTRSKEGTTAGAGRRRGGQTRSGRGRQSAGTENQTDVQAVQETPAKPESPGERAEPAIPEENVPQPEAAEAAADGAQEPETSGRRSRRTASGQTRARRPRSRRKSEETAPEVPQLPLAEAMTEPSAGSGEEEKEAPAETGEGTAPAPEAAVPQENPAEAARKASPEPAAKVRDWSSWSGWESEPAPEASEAVPAEEDRPAETARAGNAEADEPGGREFAWSDLLPAGSAAAEPAREKEEAQDIGSFAEGRTDGGDSVPEQPEDERSDEDAWLSEVRDVLPLRPGPGDGAGSVWEETGRDETGGDEAEDEEGEDETGEDGSAGRKRRRGRRGGRSHRRGSQETPEETAPVTMTMTGGSSRPVTTVYDDREPGEAGALQGLRHGKRRMYISILPGEQVEVAITNNGILDEYYLDMLHQKKIKGNIYRGVIVNIDINLQAAFVDFGTEKNGFLQIDEIHPEYFTSPQEFVRGRKYPPIQKVLRLGQEVLVQVVKEPNGSKGAFLTTWISLAGRFLVLTPGQGQIGISRKVDDEEERSRLRELMSGIDPGDDLGVIVRTVSAGVTQATLKNDLTYLKRTWNEVRRHATGVTAPACVYREPGLPERAVRDYLTDDVCEIWVDNAEIADRIRETVAMLFPHKKDLVRVHNDVRHSLWERFNLRRQLDQIYSREVLMPSGGRLVFDQTEALMAIDINSGKISCKGNFENMAFRTNMEAAETIARQLKLRDIGGQVVIDFIEMREHKHVLEVERTLRNAMKNDRARHDIARMSSFGLLELVRQRTGTSAISISMEPCPACGGTGLRRNLEWQSLQALRDIARLLRSRTASPCRFEMTQELGLYLLNHKRDSLRELENQYGKSIEIVIHP